MSGLSDLQRDLPTWVRLERLPGEPMVTHWQGERVSVTEVKAYPEALPTATFANVHFVAVCPTEGFPERDDLIAAVNAALGEGEFATLGADDLAGGPSYIALGGWLGSQDLALMLIGAVELAGIADAITPARMGIKGPEGDSLAGLGMVMLGPWRGWGSGG